MIELLTSAESWAALLTLTALEIVLGIDNVIFLSVIVSRIPQRQAKRARQIGLALALMFRILLLSLLVWLIGLTQDLFSVRGVSFSWRDIILIGGGLFLIGKATHEIHSEVEGDAEEAERASGTTAFLWVIVQIIVIDMVFSLDSIITAIGMVQDLEIMIAAVVIACAIMYISSGPVSRFVAEHPTTKMLALAFLVLIGVALVADGFKFHIPRGYIYFAILKYGEPGAPKLGPGQSSDLRGIHHIGFYVDDEKSTAKELEAANFSPVPIPKTERAETTPMGDAVNLKYLGPDDVQIDIRSRGWNEAISFAMQRYDLTPIAEEAAE